MGASIANWADELDTGKGGKPPLSSLSDDVSVDRQLLDLGCLLARQAQLEDTINVLFGGAAFVKLLSELEATRYLAEAALGTQYAFALLDPFLFLALGRDGDDRAIDAYVDIFLAQARKLSVNRVAICISLHVDLDRGRFAALSELDGADEEPAEEIVEWIVSDQIAHDCLLLVAYEKSKRLFIFDMASQTAFKGR